MSRGGGACQDKVEDRLRQIESWVAIMVTSVNFLYLGFGRESYSSVGKAERLGEAQLESLHRFFLAADGFVGDGKSRMPGKDWDEVCSQSELAMTERWWPRQWI